jgi:ribosomal-protein-alanine N-acetyltransferase
MDDVDRIAASEAAAAAHPWSAGAVRGALEAHGGHALLAVRGGALLGHLIGQVVLDEAELWSVATLPAARRAGVGRALLREAHALWRAMGATVAHLEVRDDNHGARALYAGEGWVEVGRRRGYYADGEDAILYRVELAPPAE